MKTLTASLIVLAAVIGPAALAQTGNGTVVGATDYTAVDCNAITTRQTMMKEYNETFAKGAGSRVIDVLDQRKLAATPTSISCYGAYSFSDGSTRRITYKEMINSLKQTVWTFTPDT